MLSPLIIGFCLRKLVFNGDFIKKIEKINQVKNIIFFLHSKTLHSIFKMRYFEMQLLHSTVLHSVFEMQYFRIQI